MDAITPMKLCASEAGSALRELSKRCAMIERTAGRILGALCAILLVGVAVDGAQAGETAGIPPEVVAEYLHAIIQADRTMRYDLLSRVMQTARLAGFRNLTLQVNRVSDAGLRSS